MIRSDDFRAHNKVLFSAPILKQVKVEEDFSAGWGKPCSTGEIDVIDLNGNGQADQPETKRSYSRDEPKRVTVTEPALHAPSYQALAACAERKNTEILTATELPGGVFVCNPTAEQVGDNEVKASHESIRSLDSLVAEHFDPEHPEARWAIDIARQEFVIFTPQA